MSMNYFQAIKQNENALPEALNYFNEQDKIRLCIFFHAIYYDKINNKNNNNQHNNKINYVY